MRSSSARALIRAFCFLLLLCAILITLLLVFVSQLRLDDYRHTLEQRLSSALRQRVSIGQGSLTYSHGLALQLADVLIGPEAAPLARIPRLVATLELKPLLQRQIQLDQVQIEEPHLRIYLPWLDRPEKGTSHGLFNMLGISLLTVRNATIEIYQRHGDEALKRLRIDKLHALLRGWQPQQSGQLVVSAELPRHQAKLLLETKLPAGTNPEIWRQEEYRTRFTVTGFSTASLPKLKGQQYPQFVDLDLSIEGIPAAGTRFNTRVVGTKTGERLFTLNGRWTSTAGQDSITGLSGELLNIPLTGELHYLRQEKGNYLAGRIGVTDMELDSALLKSWRVPHADKFRSGELENLTLIAEKNWPAEQKLSGLPNFTGRITLSNLHWSDPELKALEDFSVALALTGEELRIDDGILVAAGEPVDFSGSIHSLFLQPEIDLKVYAAPQLEPLSRQWENVAGLVLSGGTPVTLTVQGALPNPSFELTADLGGNRFGYRSLLGKTADTPAALTASGTLAPYAVTVHDFTLQLDRTALTGSGRYDASREEPLYTLAIDKTDLRELARFSPLLQTLKAQGFLAAELRRDANGLRGSLELEDVGAHLTRVIGDLNQTNGGIQLDRHGLSFRNLSASLGKSGFQLDGLLSDWRNPQLALDVRGTDIRAHDLIFSNPDLRLHDLDGHLKINASGIRFAPVHVRLENDTVATVRGEVTDFSDPRVDLDIQAETVNVLDVISLFQRPEGSTDRQRPEESTPVTIKVSAREGRLGRLFFTEAEGLIRDRDHRFTLYPLRFKNGSGWCRARIEFLHREEKRPLKISGHMEGINASVLHQDLFQQPGLLSGNLKADFYLEGNPEGELFWTRAKGGLHMQVSNGILRKFHGLAKVFSLLNVSQLFEGKLPDMDKEGMPFSLLTGSVRIADGRMSTQDLKITSAAMNLSLIGSQGILDDQLDFTLGVMPLRTVDKVITKIPIAGWVLTGEDKALVTAHFKVEGTKDQPKITPVPIDSLSQTVFGIFRRTLGLPGKLVKDVGSIFKKEPGKKAEETRE